LSFCHFHFPNLEIVFYNFLASCKEDYKTINKFIKKIDINYFSSLLLTSKMVMIILETDNIQYCVDVDFEDIEKNLYNYRTIVAQIGKKTRFLRTYLDVADKYPVVMLIDKNTNLLKFYKYNVEYYKLERTLYKAIIKHCNDRKKLYKIVANTKSKFQDLFNARLENLEEAMTKEYLDEGLYLYHSNGLKGIYDNIMKEFDIFDRINEPTINLRIA
jgi:hypothetical protein